MIPSNRSSFYPYPDVLPSMPKFGWESVGYCSMGDDARGNEVIDLTDRGIVRSERPRYVLFGVLIMATNTGGAFDSIVLKKPSGLRPVDKRKTDVDPLARRIRSRPFSCLGRGGEQHQENVSHTPSVIHTP